MHGDCVSKIGQWGNQSRVSRYSQLHSALSVHMWNSRYKYKRKYKYKYKYNRWGNEPLVRGSSQSHGALSEVCTCTDTDTNTNAYTNTNICTQIFNRIQQMSLESVDLPKYTPPIQCIQVQRQAQIQILIHLQQMREPPSVSWSTPSNQFIVTKYCFSAQVRSGLYLYPNLYFICIGPRLHFMQKDIWAEILSLPLSDNQSDLADALEPNLCQRPLNYDFHTLGNILFYCCPPRIGEPRHSGSAVEQVKLNKDNTI